MKGNYKKRSILSAIGLTLSTGAFGFDRSVIPPNFLYEDGTFLELSYATVQPDVTGKVVGSPKQALLNSGIPAAQALASLLPEVGEDTGSVVKDFTRTGLSIKTDLGDKVAFGFRRTQPAGNKVAYSDAVLGYNIDLEATAYDLLVKYNVNNEFSVFAGPRIQVVDETSLGNTVLGQFEVDSDTATGYSIGGGYQNASYRTQVLVNYTSKIAHDQQGAGVAGSGIPLGAAPVSLATATTDAQLKFTTPETFLLSIRQPLSQSSMLFASYRRSNWSDDQLQSNIPNFETITAMIDIDEYVLGYAYRLNPNFSLVTALSHKTGRAALYSPVNDRQGINIGARYSIGDLRLDASFTYAKLEDGKTAIPLGNLVPGQAIEMEFKNNSAKALALRLGYHF
ncbi:outer membrane protein transport protein [Marinobacter salinisoli]|uniref:Outer membrane protein transport protein n=1 Tax=Marinobacter salinisoli TaxID=2769486 RepID=A0ABX7MTI1_9GAMM|nr:outer membrane protein transport protein [Marinobacter salinisoli]QSP94745.1 outer membrane protein transport protein [Marinobacter salinisoli]